MRKCVRCRTDRVAHAGGNSRQRRGACRRPVVAPPRNEGRRTGLMRRPAMARLQPGGDMPQGTIEVGDVIRAERQRSEASGTPECHLLCLDSSGAKLTIVFSEEEAKKLQSLLQAHLNDQG